MKNTIALLFLSLSLLFNCSKVDELTKFDLDYQTSYTLQPFSLINTPISVVTPDVTTNSQSTFQNNNTSKDRIESIKLSKLKLNIDSPNDGNFNFLKEIVVYINAEGLQEIEVANAINLENTNSKTLDLDALDKELKEYLKKDSYSLRIKVTTDEAVNTTHEITIDTKFRVDAKVFGL